MTIVPKGRLFIHVKWYRLFIHVKWYGISTNSKCASRRLNIVNHRAATSLCATKVT